MKKILIVFLMIMIAGCAKKQVTAPEEPVTQKEAVKKEAEPVKKEAVKEVIEPKEAKLQEPAVVAKAAEPSIFRDVLFDYDKYNIRNDSRPVLDAAASYLKKNGSINIVIEGHCDERGTNEYNLALGEKRAKAAKDYLASLGIMPARMSVITYGEEKPLCSEQNETCWQRNRRAHFVVQGK